MAKPRVFVSSTHYDLRHIRASLDLFIDSLGFEPVLSEKGDIAYSPDRPLDESCYREAESSDIFVLIVGGRYGSGVSSGERKPLPSFFERYESITKKEYESAAARDIPIYILIEKGVYSEYQTFLRNRSNTDINYAQVDSINVFLLIEDILSRPRNNPVQAFERFEEMQSWLREQWAGLFRELLRRQSQQQQLAGLTLQVSQLKEVNETLKTYLEAVMKGTDPEETTRLIEREEHRLEETMRQETVRQNRYSKYMERDLGVSFDTYYAALLAASSLDDFIARVVPESSEDTKALRMRRTLERSSDARRDLNDARRAVGSPPFFSQETEAGDFRREIQREEFSLPTSEPLAATRAPESKKRAAAKVKK